MNRPGEPPSLPHTHIRRTARPGHKASIFCRYTRDYICLKCFHFGKEGVTTGSALCLSTQIAIPFHFLLSSHKATSSLVVTRNFASQGYFACAGDLPQKRVRRKCEQLENIVAAVKHLVQPGQVVVDFCAGGVRMDFFQSFGCGCGSAANYASDAKQCVLLKS